MNNMLKNYADKKLYKLSCRETKRMDLLFRKAFSDDLSFEQKIELAFLLECCQKQIEWFKK